MIIIRNAQHLARTLQGLREAAGMSRRGLAARLFISTSNVGDHERGRRGWTTDGTVDAANLLGHDVALIPQRHPGARYTGTGWPA